MSDNTRGNSNGTDSTPSNDNSNGSNVGINEAISYLKTKPIQSLLLIMRAATLLFTILYLVPIFSISSANLYQKALLSNAAVSALKMHQRSTPIRLTREYFVQLLVEDSAHYLFYSLLFLANQPISLVLLPITAFAFLHTCSTLLNVVNSIGLNGGIKRKLECVLNNQRQFLLLIALTEISLMPTILFSILAGLSHIFTPLFYYQFVALRYASRRSPYNRQAFHWLRIKMENYASSQSCPPFLKDVIHRVINITCRLAITPSQ